MKGLLWLGKVLALLFWAVVATNLVTPFIAPFHLAINLGGAALLLLHVLEALTCKARLADRVLILALGAFHLQSIPTPTVREIEHA